MLGLFRTAEDRLVDIRHSRPDPSPNVQQLIHENLSANLDQIELRGLAAILVERAAIPTGKSQLLRLECPVS
jgi:hypothetical protein